MGPARLHTRLGSGAQLINSTQTSRAITILMALVGCVDVPGGNLLGDLTGGFKRVGMIPRLLRLPPEIQGKRIGAEEYPLTAGANAPFIGRAHTPSAIKAMLNGDIKAFYVPGSNFVINESNSREVWEALKNLDFMVAVDFFRTPTAELADLILPAAHWLETPHLDTHVTAKARFVPELHPSVAAMLFGWWFPEKEGPEHGCFESNVNTVIFNLIRSYIPIDIRSRTRTANSV